MPRNEDLNYCLRNPLIQAINQYLSKQRKSKKSIFFAFTGLAISLIYYLKYKKKKQNVQSQIDNLVIQDPLNEQLLLRLNQEWKIGNFDNFSYLLPQFYQKGKLSIFKNIYIYITPHQNIKLGDIYIHTSSNYILNNYIPKEKLFQSFKPTTNYIRCQNSCIDFFRVSKLIPSAFIQDINTKDIREGFLKTIKYHPKQGEIISSFLANKIFRKSDLFQGKQLYFKIPQIQTINQSNILCLNCTAIILDDKIRLTKISGISNDFIRLKHILQSELEDQYNNLQAKLNLTKVFMKFFTLLGLYQLIKYVYKNLEPIMLAQEYPGLSKVKHHLNKAYCTQGNKCIHCKSTFPDFIFVPCYHMECCRSCFQAAENQIMCKQCNQNIYCGIPVYVSK